MIGGVCGTDDDCSADGITPIQGALGPFEHFDVLDIGQLLIELVGIRFQYAIDQHCNGWLAVARLGDAANRDEGIANVLRLDQGHVRHHGDEIARSLYARRPDGLLGKGVDRHWHVQQRFIALARRDHDLFERVGIRRQDRFSGQDGAHGRHHQRRQSKHWSSHRSPLISSYWS